MVFREHELEIRQIELKTIEIKDGEAKKEGKTNNAKTLKLPPFDEQRDKMDSYLSRFERYEVANGWKKETWATNLSALLKGKALYVYARLSADKALVYNELKQLF